MKRQTKHKAKATATANATARSASQQQDGDALATMASTMDSPLVVLHVIRILALYLYVLFSHHFQQETINLYEIFFPETTTSTTTTSSSTIEDQLHAAILQCVQGEINSNQFDGLIQEKAVFTAMRRLFRHHKIKANMQYHLLVKLLNRYLAQLTATPIVYCEPKGMLASTLEYLSTTNDKQAQAQAAEISRSLLYPLVNAIDSLSIEQRECLDALTTLWRWLAACDPSEMLLDRIIHLHHAVIFHIEPAANVQKNDHHSPLGACFVRTLVRHADHLFRHDLEFSDSQDLLRSDSETEYEEEEDVEQEQEGIQPASSSSSSSSSSVLTPLSPAPMTPVTPPPAKQKTAPSISPPSTRSNNNKTSTKKKNSHNSSKHKPLACVVAKIAPEDTPAVFVLDANEQPPASMMRVGIAAAATTLAAALCVIFT